MKSKSIQFLLILLVFVVPAINFAQTSGPGPGGPEGVSFDVSMNLIFIIAGLVFAVSVTIKQLRNKVAASK